MKTFRLSGNTANWVKGLSMSALNLATLAEEISTPIPSNQRMHVSVANNVFHVNDERREILKGELSAKDKDAILDTIKSDTPDFLLTLGDKVVGYATLRFRHNGTRANEPALPEETKEELADLEACYENSEMTDEEYRDEKERIILSYIGTIVMPKDGAILVVADVTPAAPKHSFSEEGLTDVQEGIVREHIVKKLSSIFEICDAAMVADTILEDVICDIEQNADWEDFEDDEWCEDDVNIALQRVMLNVMGI